MEQMAIRLKEQGEQIDFNKPGLTVYRFLSKRAQEDAQADELLKGAAESVRQAVLTGGDGQKALWEQRGQLGEDMYKKMGNTLRWVKADAERTRRELEPVLPSVMEGLEWAVKYADGTANRIFQQEDGFDPRCAEGDGWSYGCSDGCAGRGGAAQGRE